MDETLLTSKQEKEDYMNWKNEERRTKIEHGILGSAFRFCAAIDNTKKFKQANAIAMIVVVRSVTM